MKTFKKITRFLCQRQTQYPTTKVVGVLTRLHKVLKGYLAQETLEIEKLEHVVNNVDGGWPRAKLAEILFKKEQEEQC